MRRQENHTGTGQGVCSQPRPQAPPHLQSQGKAPWGRGCSVHTQERLWWLDSVTERSCVTPISRLERYILVLCHSLVLCEHLLGLSRK